MEVGMFIDLFRTDLVAGYKRVKKARHFLLSKWRFDLLRAYVKKWDKYAQDLARREVRKRRFEKRYLPWIGVGLILLCIGAIWLSYDYFCYGSLLIILTFVGGVAVLASWFAFAMKPKLPENPIAQSSKKKYVSPLKERLFPDLTPFWWRGMEIRIPSEAEVQALANQTDERGLTQWGKIGEFNLIRRLNPLVSSNTLIFHSAEPKKGDDLDVVLIGPKGLWYFEVKYLNANIAWYDGVWDIQQYDHDLHRNAPRRMKEYPDAQWHRMRDQVIGNLRANGQDLLDKVHTLSKIRGGIVFAHHEARFNIQKPAPFQWGTIGGWLKYYKAASVFADMTPEVILQVAEILLQRHQSLNPNARTYSMNTHLVKILKKQEERLQEWISAS
jgi:hypothetical protein